MRKLNLKLAVMLLAVFIGTSAIAQSWNVGGNNLTSAGVMGTNSSSDYDVIFQRHGIRAGLLSAGNTSWGVGAFSSVTTGYENTVTGSYALASTTTGTQNVANGYQALYTNSTGNTNTANGSGALYFNYSGSNNTATGSAALSNNISGNSNVATGVEALFFNTSSDNVANGFQALYSNTSGTQNVANGSNACYHNTQGSQNIANGYQALYSNTIGGYNIANGYQALYYNNGYSNIANGYQALYTNSTGNTNVAHGYAALYANTSGSNNVADGYATLYANTSGNLNTAIGANANVGAGNLSNATALGANTKVFASNNMELGDTSIVGWGFGEATPTATNVFVIGTNSTNGNGAYLTAGGAWTNGSDKNIKEDFSTLDSKDVLSHINQLPVTRWKYKGTSEYHIGPMAQDFYKAFNVGNDDKHISTIDPASIALIGVKALSIQNDSLQNANAQQQQEIEQVQQVNNNLQQQLNDLKTTISQMQTAMSQCCNNYSSNMAKDAATPLVVSDISDIDVATLQQNTPNPYTGSTVIGYHLPQSTTNAEIIVSDLTGNVLKSISLNGNGNGQITLNAGSLAAGSYFYTLLVNGQKIDTKQMVIAN